VKRKATEAPFTLHCLELLASLGPTRAKAMFGGVGLYVDDLFIALIADDRLYLKAGDAQRSAFEAAGCEPFRFMMKDGREMTLGYWAAPEEALESPPAMLPWARRAMEAALIAANAKPKRRR
jgi:DNA transformation protein and related proteins